jgi:hypothetical protein
MFGSSQAVLGQQEIGVTSMSTIVLRSVKNAPLTNTEVDTNFSNLNTDKLQVGGTYSSGTANGVLFLSSSKVLTTGSALTFDGTNLGVGGSNSQQRLNVVVPVFAPNASGGMRIGDSGNNYFVDQLVTTDGSANPFWDVKFATHTLSRYAYGGGNNFWAWYANNAEQMRLTSTGLGIGTSSPGSKLQVAGKITADAAVSGDVIANLVNSSVSGFGLRTVGGASGGGYALSVNNYTGSNLMLVDGAGNLGLGVTPSAWVDDKAVVVNFASLSSGYEYGASLAFNAYRSASNVWRYQVAASIPASRYNQTGGQHQWHTAPSGTAGNAISFSQVMTLDASGNLGVGTTSPGSYGKLVVQCNGATQSAIGFVDTNTSGRTWLMGPGTGTGVATDFGFYDSTGAQVASMYTAGASGKWVWYTNGSERARIDSSGNFLVGATSGLSSSVPGVQIFKNGPDGGAINIANTITGTFEGVMSFINGNGTVGKINTSGSSTAYLTSSDYRLKNSIAPMTGALAKVALLKPCTYKWNADGSNGEGFIAHELAEVCPDAVSGEKDAVDEDGNPKHQGIDTSFLVATLTAAIQELKAEFDAYKAAHP